MCLTILANVWANEVVKYINTEGGKVMRISLLSFTVKDEI